MTYEGIKSVILAILVLFSGLLTWGLWTYQPNFETMENGETIQEVSLSEKKDAKSIVKADRLFYHVKGNHYGTINPKEIDKVSREISRWKYSDFEDISYKIKNVSNFSQQNGMAEIIFPSQIPMQFYKKFIDLKEKDLNFSFDRIAINVNDFVKEDGFVYFINNKNNKIVESRVSSSYITVFKNNYYLKSRENDRFTNYEAYKLTKNEVIYLSENEMTLQTLRYVIDELPTESFRDFLFSDPSFVQKNYLSYGEEYSDSMTLMRVNRDKHTIAYYNPAEDKKYYISSNNLLHRSIDFINNFSGWTDNYHLVDVSEQGQSVLFRIYEKNGMPVFSDDGTSEMFLVWGENKINKFLRSNFSLELSTEPNDKILPSGKKALEQIKLMMDFQPSLLEDLVIGYKMTKDSQDRLVQLEPCWYYRYNGQWFQLAETDLGGVERGLE